MESTSLQARPDVRTNRGFMLGSLSFGHGVTHLFDQGFPLFLTDIAATMGLGGFQKAMLFGIRQGGSAVVNLGGGPVVDMAKPQWGMILTGCMIGGAISFAAMGASPNLWVLTIAVALFAIPGSLWHLPSAAAISQRFPDRRGFAISIHGFGSNVGNILGPVMTGGLLAILMWRHVFFIYAIPSLLVGVFIWWSLKDLGKYGEDVERKELRYQFGEALQLLKNPIILSLTLAAILRGIGLNAMFNWTPFYLEGSEDVAVVGVAEAARGGLGMGDFEAGVYMALITGTGVVSTPVLGALSDKYGRKAVLVPGLIAAAVMSMFVVPIGDSLFLIAIFAGIGLFSFGLHQIIQAAVLDVVGRGTEAKAIGLVFGLNGLVGIGSPFLVSIIIDHLGGYGSIFYYAGILTALTALLIVFIPMRPAQVMSPAQT